MSIESAPVEKSPEEAEAENQANTEKRLGKVEEVFDDLLDQVKDSPEAKKVALEAAIADMRKIAEQMGHVRDMKSLQELKKLMLEHWNELNELTKGDPALMASVQKWGKDFIENKIIFYDMINEVKDELTEKSQKIQEVWNRMQMGLGKLSGLTHQEFLVDMILDRVHFDQPGLRRGSGVELFIESLNEVSTGFASADLNLAPLAEFTERVNQVIRGLSKEVYSKGFFNSDQEKQDFLRQCNEIIESLVKDNTELSKEAKECSKIYKVAKKIQDTHFLKLYNQSAPEVAAA